MPRLKPSVVSSPTPVRRVSRCTPQVVCGHGPFSSRLEATRGADAIRTADRLNMIARCGRLRVAFPSPCWTSFKQLPTRREE